MEMNAYHVARLGENYALISPSGSTLDVSSLDTGLQKQADTLNEETEALRQRIAELEKQLAAHKEAEELALEALSPYLNANSPYTPDVLEAAGYLRKALKPQEDNLIWNYGQEIRLYKRGDDYELIIHHFGDDDDMHMLSSLEEAHSILCLHHGYTEKVLHNFPDF